MIRSILRKKKFKRFANFRVKCFCSKLGEMKILLCNVGIRNKLYEIRLLSKIGAYEANSPVQKRLRDFSQRGNVSDFLRLDYQTTNP